MHVRLPLSLKKAVRTTHLTALLGDEASSDSPLHDASRKLKISSYPRSPYDTPYKLTSVSLLLDKRTMNSRQFREAVGVVIDESRKADSFYLPLLTLPVISYADHIQVRPVKAAVGSGYLRSLLPTEPPKNGERWEDIQKDIKAEIMPGLTPWLGHRYSS